ncbi:hypothetical protein BDZ45DRAFT_796717 [Acephala macrosclerotiorum]|nr:hypothetical protein BDZ45DRAFT_796717 [Acephala macrosclerotiorum]
MPAYRNKTGPNRGKRLQGKGWRDPYGGSLYFQLKRDSFSRCHEVSPRGTMEDLIDDLIRDVESDYPALDEGLEFAFFLRKQALQPSNQRAFSVFDGGETVYVKIVDEEGTEYVQSYAPGGGTWEVKVRGRKPKAEDVVATRGIAEAYRLGLLR